MKKITIIVCCLFLITGCISQQREQKKQLTVASEAYYQSYGKTYEVDEYTVTLKQLRQAKKELKQQYDLFSLEACKEDTKVIFTIKNKKVEKVEIKLNCNH